MLDLFSPATKEWFIKAFGAPTKVQMETWPAIAEGKPVLVSAPTGTGKTLSAFLVFIDRLNQLAEKGELREELYVIYVSPLKSLAADIRENLKRPLDGIKRQEGQAEIVTAIRTGDTPQRERQRMGKHPPHILIITPESLYLMLTSKNGQTILRTARAIIIDELHALIDTKRGAHLMLSAARLDFLCGRRLQRIGLSATIEPLSLAAEYLSPEPAVIVHPPMEKQVKIRILGTQPMRGRRKDPVWEELGRMVYEQCQGVRSVIAFSEGRRYAEKLAYYVNQIGGDGFARVHHGSLSKEQRDETERDLREGRLRLLSATSSMELGIDVGDIDRVLQIGCPRTISSTMQRLGRAGHNPNRVSAMDMYPRTASETVYCAMTAELARRGGVERAKPPMLCLDILAQHLVSMAVGEGYEVGQVPEILKRTYAFRQVTREDVESVLRMLAGDYEHSREIPVRPRLLYDRLLGRVSGDAYSRMLSVAAGGTIPDKGLYAAKTEDGVKVGELDEEFVYESQLGDRFVLGSFAWKIVGQDKDSVIVAPASPDGARLPFWKGELKGRSLETSLEFARLFGAMEKAKESGKLSETLASLGLDEAACMDAEGFLSRQIEADGGLPNDKTIVAEHFKDKNGCSQVMVHALLGKRVNAPFSLLVQQTVKRMWGMDIGCVDDDNGFLLYAYGDQTLPDGILEQVASEGIEETLRAILPETPVFSMTFRYNAARALMMGMKSHGRQPLWMQRLKSAEMLDRLIMEKDHPLVRETMRECLEDHWDLEGLKSMINHIHSRMVRVREIHVDTPSPMSLPYEWQVEAAQMYEYTPVTPGIRQAVYDELKAMDRLKPPAEELNRQQERGKLPEDENQLHTLLMIEGDLLAGELPVPIEWLEELVRRGQALYAEPGLWIAAEQKEEYEDFLEQASREAGDHILRRMLYYRGGKSLSETAQRYAMGEGWVRNIFRELLERNEIVEDNSVYYHAKRYDRARSAYIRNLRLVAETQPPEHFAAYMASSVRLPGPGDEQLKVVLEEFEGREYPVKVWESVLLPARVKNYSEGMLDRVLAEGDYFWRMTPEGKLGFWRYEDIDWDASGEQTPKGLSGDERLLYEALCRRGATFLKLLTDVPREKEAKDVLLSLAQRGLVCADSFVPVRQWLNKEKVKKAAIRQRVGAKVMALSAGRWDVVRPIKDKGLVDLLDAFLRTNPILCRETWNRWMDNGKEKGRFPWSEALKVLRIWEYTGKVRRGYFVRGLSGAQFIRKEDFERVNLCLANPEQEIIWLNGADPALVWGKLMDQPEGREFLSVPGTAAALCAGRIGAVMERQGKALGIFEEERAYDLIKEFVRAFSKKQIFPEMKRITVKEYPDWAGELLKREGFIREMKDYVLYR